MRYPTVLHYTTGAHMQTTAVAALLSLISTGLIITTPTSASSPPVDDASTTTAASSAYGRSPPLRPPVNVRRIPLIPPMQPTCLRQAAVNASGSATPWRLASIDVATHPKAICNDGSPGVYTIRRNPGSTRWLVWLEGGGNCADGQGCGQRWTGKPDLMSSLPISNRYAAGKIQYPSSGVFSVDPNENPSLHDANLVEVQYCSSDLWSGDHAGNLNLPLNDVARWHFQGRAIALATIDDLRAKEGFDNATDIVFGGGSAGSAGIYNTIDELRENSPARARVIGISDGGYQIDYPAYDPVTKQESTVTPTPIQQIGILGQLNWGGRGDASCDATATDVQQHIACRSAETLTRNGHISTPMLIVNNQYDFNQTTRLGINIDKDKDIVADAAQQAFTRRFAARMRDQLALTDFHHAIFASYAALHVTSQSDNALVKAINGKLERDAIADWVGNTCNPARDIEEEIPGKPALR